MRDVVGNKEKGEVAVRLPNILVLASGLLLARWTSPNSIAPLNFAPGFWKNCFSQIVLGLTGMVGILHGSSCSAVPP